MSDAAFDLAFDRIFDNEGGYQNDPLDRGNWTLGVCGAGELLGTKYGLSAATYPHLHILSLSKADAKAIYKQDWWDELGMQHYPKALSYQLFDAAINHGAHRANKILQHAVGAKADGIVGPKTHAKIVTTEKNDLLMRFLAERLVFMTEVRTWNLYGKGWARRIAHNLIAASEDN